MSVCYIKTSKRQRDFLWILREELFQSVKQLLDLALWRQWSGVMQEVHFCGRVLYCKTWDKLDHCLDNNVSLTRDTEGAYIFCCFALSLLLQLEVKQL